MYAFCAAPRALQTRLSDPYANGNRFAERFGCEQDDDDHFFCYAWREARFLQHFHFVSFRYPRLIIAETLEKAEMDAHCLCQTEYPEGDGFISRPEVQNVSRPVIEYLWTRGERAQHYFYLISGLVVAHDPESGCLPQQHWIAGAAVDSSPKTAIIRQVSDYLPRLYANGVWDAHCFRVSRISTEELIREAGHYDQFWTH